MYIFLMKTFFVIAFGCGNFLKGVAYFAKLLFIDDGRCSESDLIKIKVKSMNFILNVYYVPLG